MRIGVEITGFTDAGELLADARALEAAGADSLWVGSSRGHDPWVLAAALAAATARVRLVVAAGGGTPAAATAERIARGRMRTAPAGTATVVAGADGAGERWERVLFPASKAAWRAFRDERAAAGVDGLVLENDPRLLDLLRNPDTDDDRSDLRLAYG